jgi:cytosine/adenosine deaminase-related metal-dependent hydrolase
LRFLAKHYPEVGGERILRLGTIDAARTLGRAEEIGSLEAGKVASFAVVALPDENSNDPYRLLLESETPVIETWIRGRMVSRFAPP